MNYKYLNDIYGTVLKVDIDRKKITWFTIKSMQFISRNFTLKKFIIKKSPSKKGWHIIICIKEEMTDSEIIAWQFALNSDKKRERYNLLRHTHGNKMKDWNLLFPNKIRSKLWKK